MIISFSCLLKKNLEDKFDNSIFRIYLDYNYRKLIWLNLRIFIKMKGI